MQAYPLTGNFDGVPVYDTGRAGNVGQGGRCNKQHGEDEGQAHDARLPQQCSLRAGQHQHLFFSKPLLCGMLASDCSYMVGDVRANSS